MMRCILIAVLFVACNGETKKEAETVKRPGYDEKHRPQIHFSPKANWMNDPNGLVYHNGTYHLFFQYYPDSMVWGPMHWGHATSNDLVHWNEGEIALYPDSLGYIFSGSAVVDVNNTSGLGKNGEAPIVAIFTYHDTTGIKAGRINYQTQGLAYSNDAGKTWTKYEKNPVLPNPGIIDFRDPKVMWYEAGKKWIMTLATKDRISFYSSPDLKNWIKESEFGEKVGAHGGVWECPDLIPMKHGNDSVWVLLVSINPGGPNGGSATQYFTGNFDGKTFTPFATDIRWIDYGPDDYAGITWSNVGDRKIFLGWMSNWQYGQLVPTDPWRSAMTIPRDLDLEKIGDKYMLRSVPSKELETLNDKTITSDNIDASNFHLTSKTGKLEGPARMKFRADKIESYSITLSNDSGEKLIIGYDKSANQYYIDRSKSGRVDFETGFGVKHVAPRIAQGESTDIELIIDVSSVEVFADGGLTVMSSLFFPNSKYSDIRIESLALKISKVEYITLKGAWK